LYRVALPRCASAAATSSNSRNDMARLSRGIACRRKPSAPRRKKLLGYAGRGTCGNGHELERALVFEESGELNFDQLARGKNVPMIERPDDWFNESYSFPADAFRSRMRSTA